MDHLGAYTLVKRLVTQHPEKAVDILVRYCQDKTVHNEIMTYFINTPGNGQYGGLSPSNSLNITLRPPPPTSPLDSQHSGSPHLSHRLPHRSASVARPLPPVSPPRTAPSTTSRSSKDEAAGGDYILLLTFAGKGVEEKLVRMKTARIKHSVMREDVVHKRNLHANLCHAEECSVPVPHPSVPTAHVEVAVSYCVELTWRRPHSDSTHSTTFYIVPRDMLKIDVLLGYEDSGQGASEYPPTVVPQPQHQQGYVLEEYDQGMRPPAPTPPAPSYHRSTIMYDGSARASPVQTHQHFVENLMARQHAHAAAVGDARVSQNSPAATVLGSRSSHIEHPQPLRPCAAPTAPVHDVDQHSPIDKIRLNFVWDVTPINMWLDLRGSGEAFFSAFQQLVEKRKGIFERDAIIMYLKKDKQTPNDEAYALSLSLDELEADWETTVAWLEENRRDKPPHVFGRVQVGEG